MRLIPNGTKGGRRPFAIALLFTVLATALIAGPAAAATPPMSDYGNTVQCRYKTHDTGPGFDYRLKSLVVTPPVLFANKAHQQVGWQFVVTRSMNYGGDPWEVTYKSPIQKRPATPTTAADFDAQRVGVNIPDVENVVSVRYHVTLKLYRYRANGTVQSKTSYLMPYMEFYKNGQYDHDWTSECTAGFYDGP
jgi:hypothetical protein